MFKMLVLPHVVSYCTETLRKASILSAFSLLRNKTSQGGALGSGTCCNSSTLGSMSESSQSVYYTRK